MVDNFNTIAEIIRKKSLNSGDFFFLEILKRKKDNPLLYKHVVTIQHLNIRDADHLMERKDVIIDQCNANNARAYFRLNKRNERRIALETMKSIATSIANDNYNIQSTYQSICGQFHSDPEKTWVIDLDFEDIERMFPGMHVYSAIEKFIDDIGVLKREVGYTDECDIIKTKNGFHVITRPFNIDKFKKTYPYALPNYHKDNPTILYIP